MQMKRKDLFFSNPPDTIYHSEYFNHRFKEEKQRTDRTGDSFSLIIIDFHRLLNGKGLWKFFNGTVTKEICQTLLENTRFIDLKGWYDKDRLAVLLPETSEEGARVLLKRLQKEFEEELKKFLRFKDFIKDKIILTSSTYPLQRGENKAKKEEERDGTFRKESSQMRITKYLDHKTYYKKNGKTFWKKKEGFFFLKLDHEAIEISPVLVPFMISNDLRSYFAKGIKRLMDIVGSLLGITVFAPIMLIASLLIKMTSSGPILFKQERIGYLGKRFTFLKFRSMYKDVDHGIHEAYMTNFIKGKINGDAREEKTPVFKLKEDPRITPIGRFLRKTSIDELPQLFNVLLGDMSLVGPRPPILYEVNNYKLWHRKRIMEVKPGITGLWQVSGRSSTSFEDMVRLDLYYVNHWSLRMDIIILFKTMKAVLLMKGAY